jgi:glycosyltransferase involved in cell wall biosynthesis
LRVCLDATISVSVAGIAAYAEGLTAALRAHTDIELAVVRPPSERGKGVINRGGTREVASRLLWRERNLPRMVADTHAEVLVAAQPELPLHSVRVPTVVVVHDVIPLTAPALAGRGQQLRFRFLLPRVLARATSVVCVSDATRVALQKAIPLDSSKCTVIAQGPSPFPVLPRTPDPESPYLLYVGELFKRKNLETLVAAAQDQRVRLLIAGPGEPYAIGDHVRHLGFVPDQRLAELYAGAAALVMPSVEEGFGRPVLDAMARGVPVIASDIPALRELTAGSGAYLVDDPLDPAQWRAAVRTVLGDEALREELSARGRARAEQYSWRAVAAQWADLLDELAAG